jgi:predicted transcriptional regulator
MARHTYQQAYETAKLDLVQALTKRDQLDQKIRKLKQSVKALGDLCGADPEEIEKLLMVEGFAIDSRMGFTDAIRRLFRFHKGPLHPTEIRDDLLKVGIGEEQVNLLSSIHTVLRRLVENGEIEKTEDGHFQGRS